MLQTICMSYILYTHIKSWKDDLVLGIAVVLVNDPQEVVPIEKSTNLAVALLLNSQRIPVNCGELASDGLVKV
jgi:hypothetical protein